MIKNAPENQAAGRAPANKADDDPADDPEGYVCVIEEPLREAVEAMPPNVYEDPVDHELEDAMGLGPVDPNEPVDPVEPPEKPEGEVPPDAPSQELPDATSSREAEREGVTVVVAKPVGKSKK